MTPALFFDLDGTLCQPGAPFADRFFASLAPMLAAHPTVDGAALLAAWAAALERPRASNHCKLSGVGPGSVRRPGA